MHAAQKPFAWFILSTGAAPFVLGGAVSWGAAIKAAAANQTTSSIIYGTHFRSGIWRLTAKHSNGTFAMGHGAPLNGQVFNQYFGLNGIGQTTKLTATNLSSIPTWAKWAAGIGGGSVLANQLFNHDE
jgi:hypothetical protein